MNYRLDDGQIEVIDDAMAEVLRAKTPGQRMLLVAQAWRTARMWIEAAVRSQHADWADGQIRAEVNRRMAGGAG